MGSEKRPVSGLLNDDEGGGEKGVARILVVDDDEMNRDMLSRRLERKGYAVGVACGGREALGMIEGAEWDVVLLDIMMPEMDGLEVLGVIRGKYGATELPVIMATAKAMSEDVAGALRLGANDYVTKPLDFAVVLARLETQIGLKRTIEKNKRLERNLTERNAELEEANGRMSRDLKAAAAIQRSMLPVVAPACDGARFAWVYEPCDELAGDALNIMRLDEGRIGLYVLDVTGHGVAASLLSVSMMRSLSPRDDSTSMTTRVGGASGYEATTPDEVARLLNAGNPMMDSGNQFATLLYGVLDGEAKTFTYTAAGHPAPIFLRVGQAAKSHDLPALPIGVDAAAEYERYTLNLERGDRVCLYSDGAIEEVNGEREQFSRDRLTRLFERLRDRPLDEAVDGMVEALRDWRGGGGGGAFTDDVSFLAFEIE